jgi:hypothetical protein
MELVGLTETPDSTVVDARSMPLFASTFVQTKARLLSSAVNRQGENFEMRSE